MIDQTDTTTACGSTARRGIWTAALVTALASFQGGGAAIGGQGEFRVSDYGSGVITNNYLHRGYYFEVSREVTVTALIGGGGAQPRQEPLEAFGDPPDFGSAEPFAVGLFEASLDPSQGDYGEYRLERLLTPEDLQWEERGPDQVLEIPPVTLEPGQGYFIGQNRVSRGHHWALDNSGGDGLIVDDLMAHPLIEEWAPHPGSGEEARSFQPSGTGPIQERVGTESTSHTPILPRLGMVFETETDPATVRTGEGHRVTSDEALLRGELTDTGDTQTNLYLEFGQDPELADGTVREAEPASTQRPRRFELRQDGFDPGETYYYRAVAVNEAGRAEGEIRELDMSAVGLSLPDVEGLWEDDGVLQGVALTASWSGASDAEPEWAGFEYVPAGEDFSDAERVSADAEGGTLTAQLRGLLDGRAYRVRAAAELDGERTVSPSRWVRLQGLQASSGAQLRTFARHVD
ncbi:hypothetical protein [Halorhodospira abdelmalekii]|uniref:hypothetical protein n=1 Tax=Halorhodospira abdelmalekii TaxID=421629 RepID=UPI001902EC25|nr:hypothetical protein [Halorhodospira abdelmalekii]